MRHALIPVMQLSVATVAYNNAVQYAKERIQGRLITNPKGTRVPIIQHEDVRRMLLGQKSTLEAMRAMIFQAYYFRDIITYGKDPADVQRAKRRTEVITPLIKAYCSDQAWSLIADAIQVHAGYGFSEEYPVARQARDCKIYSIWEGTNYLQSMDLISRKWLMEEGKVFREWFQELASFIKENNGHSSFAREFGLLSQAIEAYQEVMATIGKYFAKNVRLVPVYSTRILRIAAELYCGCLLMEQALVAERKLGELSNGNADRYYYDGKIQSARFYVRNLVPDIMATMRVIKEGDTSAFDILEESF